MTWNCKQSARTIHTVLMTVFLFLGISEKTRAFENAPKILVRTGGGILANTAEGQSSSTAIAGGLNVVGEYYLTHWLSAGVGYRADFDLTNSTTPLRGFDVHGRLYFWGDGTNRKISDPDQGTRYYRDLLAAYVIGEFSSRQYFFQSVDATAANGVGEDLSGNASGINFGAGVDYALSKEFELNVEGTVTVLSFSSDPTNVKLTTTLFVAGLGYMF
jgi:hypothetical protein